MKKFRKDYKILAPALKAAAKLANGNNVPYYIYKMTYGIAVTNFDDLLDIIPCEKIVVHPFEPSEMSNKENGKIK